VQEENGRKSSTREFLSFVPTACFEATTMKVADIFFNLWKKEKNPKKGSESLSQRPLIGQAPNTSSSPKLQLKQFSPKKRCLPRSS
jgi:hypothetical protein